MALVTHMNPWHHRLYISVEKRAPYLSMKSKQVVVEENDTRLGEMMEKRNSWLHAALLSIEE
jgi:hypothetical protein